MEVFNIKCIESTTSMAQIKSHLLKGDKVIVANANEKFFDTSFEKWLTKGIEHLNYAMEYFHPCGYNYGQTFEITLLT